MRARDATDTTPDGGGGAPPAALARARRPGGPAGFRRRPVRSSAGFHRPRAVGLPRVHVPERGGERRVRRVRRPAARESAAGRRAGGFPGARSAETRGAAAAAVVVRPGVVLAARAPVVLRGSADAAPRGPRRRGRGVGGVPVPGCRRDRRRGTTRGRSGRRSRLPLRRRRGRGFVRNPERFDAFQEEEEDDDPFGEASDDEEEIDAGLNNAGSNAVAPGPGDDSDDPFGEASDEDSPAEEDSPAAAFAARVAPESESFPVAGGFGGEDEDDSDDPFGEGEDSDDPFGGAGGEGEDSDDPFGEGSEGGAFDAPAPVRGTTEVRTTPVGARPTPVGVRPTPVGVRPTPLGVRPTFLGVRPTPVGVRGRRAPRRRVWGRLGRLGRFRSVRRRDAVTKPARRWASRPPPPPASRETARDEDPL